MPDRWGRPTASDWKGVSNSLGAIQDIRRKDTLFSQQQEDRGKRQLLEADSDYNAGEASKGEEGAPLRGSSRAKLLGKQIAAQSGQADTLLRQQSSNKTQDSVLGSLVSWKQQNPGESWGNAPKELYPGVAGQRAFVDAQNMTAETLEGKKRTQDLVLSIAAKSYPIFEAQKSLAQESLKNGDTNTAVNVLQQMANELPLPYKLGAFDNETQSFDVQYQTSEHDDFQSSGTQSLQQVMKKVNAMGEKEHTNMIALTVQAVNKGNQEKRQNPSYGKNSKGDRFLVIPKKQLGNPNQVEIEVRNEKTNEETTFNSWKAMNDFGIQVENLDREKGLQAIKSSQAKTRATNRAGVPGGKWAARTMYKDGKEFKPRNSLEERRYSQKGWDLEKPAGPGGYKKTTDRIDYEDKAAKAYKEEHFDASEEKIAEVKAETGTAFQAQTDNWAKKTIVKNGKETPVYQTPNGFVDQYGQAVDPEQKKGGGGQPDKNGPARQKPRRKKTSSEKEASNFRSSSKQPTERAMAENKTFKGYMDSMAKKSGLTATPKTKKAMEITRGEYDPDSNTIVFKPKDKAALKKAFLSMTKAGIKYDAVEGKNGEVIITLMKDTQKIGI